MKKILVALLVLTPHLLLAQPGTGELEEQVGSLTELVQQGRYQEALELGGEAEQLATAAGQRSVVVRVGTLVGDAHQGLGDLDAALASFRGALKLAREIDEKPAIADNLLRIGKIHARERRLPPAAETLRRALAAATEIGSRDRQRDAEAALAETYAAMGSFRQAYEASRRHQELAGEISQAERDEVVAELETQIEADRRQRELESSQQQQLSAERQQALASERLRTRVLTGLAIAGAIALLFIAISYHRLKGSSARELADQTLDLERETAELQETAAELERHRVELERQSAELEGKSTELDRVHGVLEETAAALEEKSTALDDDTEVLERTATELEEFRQRYRRDITDQEVRNAATAERSDELERFLSTVSQHLKILLVTVRGALGSLEEAAAAGSDPPEGEVEYARLAVGEVVRLLDRLLQLLLVGRMVHAPEEVSLSELAFEAVGQAADLVADRSVEIVIAPGMPPVFGDREQLLEVLRQLLENSGRFLGEQPAPRLEVGWRPRREEEPPIFTVGDNGPGIDPRDHEKAFTLFERLDANQGGDGIGLALVRRIVEAHDGRVWIESEGAGKGTTVCFTLGESGDYPPSRERM